jgi:hypothetical protein
VIFNQDRATTICVCLVATMISFHIYKLLLVDSIHSDFIIKEKSYLLKCWVRLARRPVLAVLR